ncbi:hypothetical protein OQA88_10771 [Cercophora sp. LCS_1]
MASYFSSSPWPTAAASGLPNASVDRRHALQVGKMAGATFILALSLLLLTTSMKKGKSNQSFLTNNVLYRAAVKKYRSWEWLFRGVDMIQEEYNRRAGSEPFELSGPDGRYVFVTTPEHLKEIEAASGGALSLYAASNQSLQPWYTMSYFGWNDIPPEGYGFVRAIRTHLTNNLPNIVPNLSKIVRSKFEELHEKHPVVSGVRQSPVSRTMLKIVVAANAHAIFGQELASDENFVEATLEYTEQLFMCAEIIRLVPRRLVPLVGAFMTWKNTAQRTLYETLMPIAIQRCNERDLAAKGRSVPKHNDCMQWLLESSTSKLPRTPQGVVRELMAIWFASTTTFALQDLALHPEYLDPLRSEITAQYTRFEQTGQGLPLLDSFIKESARLTPVESLSTRRCAVKPFSFTDGTKLRVGDWACTPVSAMMQDAKWYPDPLKFSGFRFVSQDLLQGIGNEAKGPMQDSPSSLVAVGDTFHMWGSGRQTCPGRYYAAALTKVIIAQVIANYDLELVKPEAPRWFTWRSSTIPREDTMMVFRRQD